MSSSILETDLKIKSTRVYVLNNMTQMLQVSKNSNIKYNIIQII